MFLGCEALVGGQGKTYNERQAGQGWADHTYSGYFTCIDEVISSKNGKIELNEQHFPDENFRAYLKERAAGGSTTLDVWGKKIELGDMSSWQRQGNRYITDLTGMEWLMNLQYLSCTDSKVKSADFSHNPNLRSLSVSGTDMLYLNISKNNLISNLYLKYVAFNHIDLSIFPELGYLDCTGSQFTSLDLSANPNLSTLRCGGNRLIQLDVSANTKLTRLDCNDNLLEALDVTANTALKELDLAGNSVKEIDLSKNTALKYFSCSGNSITSLDLSSNTALQNLYCYNNKLSTLDISMCPELSILSCMRNALTSVKLPQSSKLTILSIYDNQIKGNAMDEIIACLPTVENKNFTVYHLNSPLEGNICTVKQVADAKEKGWTAQAFVQGITYEDYPGYDAGLELSVEPLEGAAGRTLTLPIALENQSENLTGFQFDLTLPEGFSLATAESTGSFLFTKTGRFKDANQSLTIQQLENGDYRFLSFSLSNGVITGNSGVLVNVIVQLSESLTDGSYEGSIHDIIFTQEDGSELGAGETKFNILVSSIIPGDANGDGKVNVSDIVEMVNCIMDKPSAKFTFAAADIDGNGKVNVTDIVKVVSIIMSQQNVSGARHSAARSHSSFVGSGLSLVGNTDGRMSICLNSEDDYVAAQFDICLAENQTLEDISLNALRSNGHLLNCQQTGLNRYRVVVYSFDNATFWGNDGELLSVSVSGQGDLLVENIMFVTSDMEEHSFAVLNTGTTGIGNVGNDSRLDVYGLDGRLIRRQVFGIDGLPKGLYIVNGRKTVVK